MRVASEATLKRAAELRRGEKTWLELTRTPQVRQSGLDFFKGAKDDGGSKSFRSGK